MIQKSKMIPGPFKEITEGATDHGGTFSVIYYFNSRYKPVVKERATRGILHEYDEKNRSVHREYYTMVKGEPVVHTKNHGPVPRKRHRRKNNHTSEVTKNAASDTNN